MNNNEFLKALPILKTLLDHGHEAYFVGGSVRDMLLKRSIKDIDITTSAKPEEVMTIFSKVIPVGVEHGTVIVRHEGKSYEVTTFRFDGDYTNKRHPDDVFFTKQLSKDLERRDFTINALAMDLNGQIIDLFNGQTDMAKQQIKAVGNGYERFKEDALRMIRAIRFSSELGFNINEETLEEMVRCKSDISFIAIERITSEMTRFFSGSSLNKGITYLLETKIYEELPIFKENHTLLKKIPKNMQPLSSFASVITLFHYLDPRISISYWVKQWKCSNDTKKTALHLFTHLQYFQKNGLNKTLVYHLNKQVLEEFIILVNILISKKLNRADIEQVKNKLPIASRKDLIINGRDLLKLFPNRKSGPWIKELLNEIEHLVLHGELQNQMNDIKEWLRCNQREIN